MELVLPGPLQVSLRSCLCFRYAVPHAGAVPPLLPRTSPERSQTVGGGVCAEVYRRVRVTLLHSFTHHASWVAINDEIDLLEHVYDRE